MNVFFVSNSTCYYFMDELFGLLEAAGHEDAVLALVYIGGCSVEKHLQLWKEKAAEYQFRVQDKNGLHITENCSLETALGYGKWDLIGFDNNAKTFASGDAAIARSITEPHFGELFAEVRKLHPNARFAWHEVWANEEGYHAAFEMTSKAQRTKVYEAKKGLMGMMMQTYGIEGVPTGDAWEKVRDMDLFTRPLEAFPQVDRFTLCSRLDNGQFKDDFSHDGDIGGGQYLNACVWFERITGESCVGNTFRPKYEYEGKDCSLTEEKIQVLQRAAHEAVQAYLSAE